MREKATGPWWGPTLSAPLPSSRQGGGSKRPAPPRTPALEQKRQRGNISGPPGEVGEGPSGRPWVQLWGGRARPRLSLDTYNREGNSGEPGVGGAVASRRLSPPNQRQQLLPLSLTSPGLRFASSCQVLGAARNPDVSVDAPNRFNINRLFFKIEHTWEPNGVPSGHSWPTGRPLATPARALTAIILWRVTSPGYSRGHGGPARSGGSPQGPHGRSNPRGTGLASGIQTSGLG